MTELDIPCPDTFIGNEDLKTISEDFHTTYRERYSVAERENDVELVAWRLTAIGDVDAPKRPPPQGQERESAVGKTRFFDTVYSNMAGCGDNRSGPNAQKTRW